MPEAMLAAAAARGPDGGDKAQAAAAQHHQQHQGRTTPLLDDEPEGSSTAPPSDGSHQGAWTIQAARPPPASSSSSSSSSAAAGSQPAGGDGLAAAVGGGSCTCGTACGAVLAMRRDLAAKDEQVQALQAQVQRLASFVEGALNSDSGNSAAGLQVTALQLKLLERSSELSSSQDALCSAHQQAQELQSRVQASADAQLQLSRQAAALKLLLAEHLREEGALLRGLLRQQEQLEELRGLLAAEQASSAAAHKDLLKKTDQVNLLQDVLLAANQQLADLQAAAPHALSDHQQLEATKQRLAALEQQAEEEAARAAAADRAVADLKRQLAVKADMLQHFTRRATGLEQQVRDLGARCAELQAAADPNNPAQQALHSSCSAGIVTASSTSTPAAAAAAAAGVAAAELPPSPPPPPQPAAPPAAAPAPPPPPLPAGTAASSSSPVPEGLAMGALARVTALMGSSREPDAAQRLRDELRSKELAIKELQDCLARAEDQVHGLQVVMVTKTSACNRLEAELRQAETRLKQAVASSSAEEASLQAALEEAVAAAEHEHQLLAAAEEREAALSKEILAVRGQLQDVLEALLVDTDALRRLRPEEYAALQAMLPALAAEVGVAAELSADDTGPGGSSGDVCDKQLLLGPVLPGLARKGPSGGLAGLGRLFSRHASSSSSGPDGLLASSSPWITAGGPGGRKGRGGEPFTSPTHSSQPHTLAVAARATMEWLQRGTPPRTSLERTRSGPVEGAAAAAEPWGAAAWGDAADGRPFFPPSTSSADGKVAVVLAAAAAAAAAAMSGHTTDSVAHDAGGRPLLETFASAPAATGGRSSSSAVGSSTAAGCLSAGPPTPSAPAAAAAAAAAAEGGPAASITSRLPRSLQQRFDAVKALVNKIGSSTGGAGGGSAAAAAAVASAAASAASAAGGRPAAADKEGEA